MFGQILAHTALGGAQSPGGPVPPGGAERLGATVVAWGAVTGVLRREVSSESALVLAEPVAGPSRGAVAWHTPLEGVPREFRALSGIERQDAERAVRQRASELSALAARMSASQDPSARAASRLLSRIAAALAARAAGLPGPETVWVVGGIPVLAGWGIPPPAEAVAAPPPPSSLPSPPRPYPPAPPGHVPFQGAAPPLAGQLPPLQPVPPGPGQGWTGPGQPVAYPAVAQGDPDLLRPALAALGVFLLALLLFFALSPGFRSAAGALPGPGPSAGLVPEIEEGLRAELRGLKDRYRDSLRACRPDDALPPVDDEPLSLPDPEGREEPPPSAGDAPRALEAAPPPPPPPTEEPKPDPKPDPKPAEKPKSAAPKPKAGGRLQIPQGAKDVSFLKGCWKSDAGIFNRMGTPLYCYYCFDGNGHAKVRVEELDRRGRVTRTCRATATARLSGGKLHIRDTGARCPSPPNYVPDTVVCTPTGAAANCQLQSDGGRRFPTRITYQGG